MKKSILIFAIFILAACSTTAPSATTPTRTTTPPDPTLTPTATTAPTSTSTPAPSITPSPTPVPNGPCDNPLVPLATGNQWLYRATTDNGEFLYTLKALERSDSRNIAVIMEFIDQTRGDTVQERVVCQNGAIDNFPLFLMDMHLSDFLDKLFDTYHDKGVYAPGYAAFVENNWELDWETDYLTEDRVSVKNPIGGPDLYLVESSPIHLSFQMDGSREGVNVPAGDFPQAIKVSHRFSMIVTLTLPTGGTGGSLILNTTQWYQPYVGLIRAQVDSAWVETGGQEFSAPFHSVVELVEFTPGQ
ncbi:MAG: hypothetical protein JW757_12975 [Anaerolineales bacterium]|nr:hypothetical protein [Anaerolineales bacterium]